MNHKDDDERRRNMVLIRFTDDELAWLREQSESERHTVSRIVRRILQEERDRKQRSVDSEV